MLNIAKTDASTMTIFRQVFIEHWEARHKGLQEATTAPIRSATTVFWITLSHGVLVVNKFLVWTEVSRIDDVCEVFGRVCGSILDSDLL